MHALNTGFNADKFATIIFTLVSRYAKCCVHLTLLIKRLLCGLHSLMFPLLQSITFQKLSSLLFFF